VVIVLTENQLTHGGERKGWQSWAKKIEKNKWSCGVVDVFCIGGRVREREIADKRKRGGVRGYEEREGGRNRKKAPNIKLK